MQKFADATFYQFLTMHTAIFLRHITTFINLFFLNAATHMYPGSPFGFRLHMLGSGMNYYTDGISSLHVNTVFELKINE